MEFTEHFLDFKWFAERFFCIRDRRDQIIPFKLNQLQEELYPNLLGRDDVLKARKGGVSTMVELMILHQAIVKPNFRGLILAHEHKSAIDLFDIVKTAYDHLPQQLKPKLDVDARQEMAFSHNKSRIQAHTAKNPELGRGGTISALHCSEIAFWDTPQRTLTAAGASMGDKAWTFRESTANGAGTYWHVEWIRGKSRQSGYKTHFFNWLIEPSYVIEEPDSILDPDEFDIEGKRVDIVLTEKERGLGCSEGQSRWRRRKVREFGHRFAQEYAEDDVTCFLTSGRSIFDNLWLQQEYEKLIMIEDLVKHHDQRLGLKIYKEYTKEELRKHSFVIGADPSEGIEDEIDPTKTGDACSAYVLERYRGIQVASVHGIWEPYEFAQILERVGVLFATAEGPALLGVERNSCGTAVLSELHNHIHYPALYWQHEFDEVKRKTVRRLGWRTTTESRPIMVDGLVKAVNNRYMKVSDPDFLAECMTFVRNRRGKPEAQSGCYDDRVMAAAIAWQMRQRTSSVPLVGANLR